MLMGMDYVLRDHFDGLQVHIVRSTQKLQLLPHDFIPNVVLWIPAPNISFTGKKDGAEMIRNCFPKTPLAVYSQIVDYENICEFFEVGAQGYVADKEIDELTDCLRALLKGDRFVSIPVLLSILEELEIGKDQADGALLAVLSPREWQVARYVDKGVRAADIADLLLIKKSTVNKFKANIYSKLNIGSAAELRAMLKNPGKIAQLIPDEKR